MNSKDFIVDRTKRYFAPIKSVWFWVTVIMLTVVVMIIEHG